jgi:hypothetical protein
VVFALLLLLAVGFGEAPSGLGLAEFVFETFFANGLAIGFLSGL